MIRHDELLVTTAVPNLTHGFVVYFADSVVDMQFDNSKKIMNDCYLSHVPGVVWFMLFT